MDTFRPSTPADVLAILDIIAQAQEIFRLAGIDQWQNGYPNESVFMKDISENHSFVLERDGIIIATAMISFDGEPTYDQIQGKWMTDNPYVVIHRIAVMPHLKGQNIAGYIIGQAETMCRKKGIKSIRIDTHQDNQAMQRVIEKTGFQYCGIITLTDGALRLAYEKVL